jgi:hypothetical protein
MPLTSAQKQARRREKLDAVAADLGYDSHYQMMTDIANGEIAMRRKQWTVVSDSYSNEPVAITGIAELMEMCELMGWDRPELTYHNDGGEEYYTDQHGEVVLRKE